MAVTTGSRPRGGDWARVYEVARRCGLPIVERAGSLERALADAGADMLYVVWREREELWTPTARIGAHEALLGARLESGSGHPLLQAVAPDGPDGRPVVDGTLGLAADALHLAAGLGVDVIGCESSPVVLCLALDGLRRLARGREPAKTAARRIRVVDGDFGAALAGMPDDSAQAVYVSPMFHAPRGGVPGYDLFRRVAEHAPFTARHLREALRVAPRFVLKIGTADPVPAFLADVVVHRHASTSVHYLVVDRDAAAPEPPG